MLFVVADSSWLSLVCVLVQVPAVACWLFSLCVRSTVSGGLAARIMLAAEETEDLSNYLTASTEHVVATQRREKGLFSALSRYAVLQFLREIFDEPNHAHWLQHCFNVVQLLDAAQVGHFTAAYPWRPLGLLGHALSQPRERRGALVGRDLPKLHAFATRATSVMAGADITTVSRTSFPPSRSSSWRFNSR